MICLMCRTAADARAPESEHCGSTGGPGAACDCQHRTDRYRPLDGLAAIAHAYDQLARIGEQTTELPRRSEVRPIGEPLLTARRLTTWLPACDEGRHHPHPWETCDEFEADCAAAQAAWDRLMARFPVTPLMQASEVPSALRGTATPVRNEGDGPLRRLAAQALGELRAPIIIRRDPRADDGVSLYEQVIAMFGGPLPPYAPPVKGSCACGGGGFDGQSIHAPDCPVRPARLRAIEAQLDALLPEQAREAGIHFAYDTTTED